MGQRFLVGLQDGIGPRDADAVDFAGELRPISTDALPETQRSSPGKRDFSRRPAADAERLEGWLIDQGYRQAIVEPGEVIIDWEAATVRVLYAIELGPHFEIEILGGDPKTLKKKGLLPFLEQQRFDEALPLAERVLELRPSEPGYQRLYIEIRAAAQEKDGL